MKNCPKCNSKSWKLYKGFDGLVWYECMECRYAQVARGKQWMEAVLLLAILFGIGMVWVYIKRAL